MKIQYDTNSPEYAPKPYYFSFGCGSPFAQHHVCVWAHEREEAREGMVKVFGAKWCWCYDEDEWNAPSTNSQLSKVGDMAPFRLVTLRLTLKGWKANV